MPFAGAPGPAPTLADSIVPLLHVSFHPFGHAVAEIVTLPGQVVVSFLLVAAASRHLWTRGRIEAAVFWLCGVVARGGGGGRVPPRADAAAALPARRAHRGVRRLLAERAHPARSNRRRGARRCLAAAPTRSSPLWLVAVMVLLELAGFHTPTDILGGLLLAVVAATAAIECERSGLLRRRALRRMRTTA